GQELDVVDQQQVDVPVLVAKRERLRMLDRIDHLVREVLRRHVTPPGIAKLVPHRVSERVQQVRLAQARTPENEQWVVSVSRILGDGETSGMRETVTTAD